MAKFMLILREDPATFANMSPDELQAVIAEYTAWCQKLGAKGVFVGGEKLVDEGGRHVSARSGSMVVTDGPYAEAKEVIGGYMLVQAEDYSNAVTLVSDCPHTRYGVVEIRRVDEMEG